MSRCPVQRDRPALRGNKLEAKASPVRSGVSARLERAGDVGPRSSASEDPAPELEVVVNTRYETDRGQGWLIFSGIVLMVAGVMRFFDGLWAFRYKGSPGEPSERADRAQSP